MLYCLVQEVNCPVLPLIHPGADSWVEGWQPESSQFGLPKVSSLPVRFEEDVFSQDDMKAVELDTPEHERAYREHFLSRVRCALVMGLLKSVYIICVVAFLLEYCISCLVVD